ncbi:TapB family protein [Bacteroides gallinaceum]|uniref:DUF3108 domain-containing protein n=2 Tax=Bacteroidaceae TaxID=815 RepID=A0ABT7VFV5_9BACE|nr:hypothetical protein [Bacteroides gallinaceum]MBU3855511.1 hypothetical protein [Candidatus Phocaeicola excrementipullorum]MBW9199070.1 hypothetical protein [Bacteroidales bacterium SW299]MDM8209301.1 hypothetical protein [Bacteroides gallinaceum]MDM8325173.1 hypothetical protein [Bacteroides gallinaceum]
MKKTCLTFAIAFFALAAQAQYCNTEKGTALLYISSDRQANETRIDTTLISAVRTQDRKTLVEQTLCNPKTRGKDSIFDDNSTIKFAYGTDKTTERIIIDENWGVETMQTLQKELAPQEKGMPFDPEELERTAGNHKGAITIPLRKDITEGEKIPSGKFTIKASFMKAGLEVSKGRYEGFEKVTVPAGAFNCLKVSYKLRKNILYLPRTVYVTQWYAEGIGLVKEETADKKGYLKQSKTLLRIISPE